MIETPQHLIPDFVTAAPHTTTSTTKVIANVTKTLVNVTNANLNRVNLQGPSTSTSLGLVIAIIVVLLVLAIIMLTKEPVQRSAVGPSALSPSFSYGDKYVYRGRKLLIRRLYLNFLSFLEGLGLRLPRGYTPREVARVALKRGIEISSKISYLYYRFMYRPEEPSDNIVDEVNEIEKKLKVRE